MWHWSMQSVCHCFINGIPSFVFDENNYGGFQKFICQISMSKKRIRLQTTQHTSDGAVTADTNCVETSRPQQWGRFTVLWASRPCEPVGWLTLLLIKSGDVETNPGPTTSHKRIWICDIFYNQIHALGTIPEPRVPPTCHALTTTTPHPSPTPSLLSTSHHHTISANTHAT